MKRIRSFLVVLGYLLTLHDANGFSTPSYVGVDLYAVSAPDGASNFFPGSSYGGSAMAGGQVVGEIDFGAQGVLWDLPSGAPVNLHPTSPAAYSLSSAQGTDGVNQVGYGTHTALASRHALLWHGAANTAVDLHPSALTAILHSVAIGVSGNQQVGSGTHESSTIHALLWSGTPGSAVDLHPTLLDGILDSTATATDGIQQVGFTNRFVAGSAESHAIAWSGTADSAVDLHPMGFSFSTAIGVGGGQQVGWANNVNGSHPMLWTGTAESAIDLSPISLGGIVGGAARATNGLYQVGSGIALPNFTDRALLWKGSADSAVDLHALLPPGFRSSIAYSIDADGTIWGLAVANDAQFTTHAVPEPSALALLSCSAGARRVIRLRKWRAKSCAPE